MSYAHFMGRQMTYRPDFSGMIMVYDTFRLAGSQFSGDRYLGLAVLIDSEEKARAYPYHQTIRYYVPYRRAEHSQHIRWRVASAPVVNVT